MASGLNTPALLQTLALPAGSPRWSVPWSRQAAVMAAVDLVAAAVPVAAVDLAVAVDPAEAAAVEVPAQLLLVVASLDKP
jgi:hypothetical protein